MPISSGNLNDPEIIRRVLEGDVDAFELLVSKYKDDVLSLVARHVPRDLIEETAQEVFVRAWRSLSSFQGKSGFKTWLATIAVRACYDHWRKYYRSREIPVSAMSEQQRARLEGLLAEGADRSLSDKAAQKEIREILDDALLQLSPEDRMVIELVYLEGKSGKEAAALLGWSVANVKVRSYRSRKNLLKLFSELTEGLKE